MRLSDGVQDYVARRHTSGFVFERGESHLVAFSRFMGEVSLDQIKDRQVSAFLNGFTISPITWRLKYYVLLRFFEHWSARGAMPEFIMSPPKPKVRQTFVPYVYTRIELKALLKATATQNGTMNIDRQTLRGVIIFLYATGTKVAEMLSLKYEDVDLDKGRIIIRNKQASRSRQIPIGTDLMEILKKYRAWRVRRKLLNSHFFVTRDDKQLSVSLMRNHWQRLRRIAVITRHDESIYQPRMDDLRWTFAVHRITEWIRSGADLNRMLPALAAYMGQVGLGATERYLAMTPERFREQLNKLSPVRAKGRWRNNRSLMEFLATL